MRRPDLESALPPEYLESCLARTVERCALGAGIVQVAADASASERVMEQSLFQEALEGAKSDQESMEYFSMIAFAVDCYAEVAALVSIPTTSHSGTGRSMDIC
jgi:hypothetical protein